MAGDLIPGLFGRFESLPEKDIPPPPEAFGVLLYPLFRARLDSFLRSHGVREYLATSGFRNASRNERVGGAENSAHLFGMGADIVIRDIGGAGSVDELARDWADETGGVAIVYGDHVHFNVSRIFAWRVLRWFALFGLLAVVALFLFFFVED